MTNLKLVISEKDRWEPPPPMGCNDLVDAKWGLTSPTQRELAEAAIYWLDQAYKWRIVAEAND